MIITDVVAQPVKSISDSVEPSRSVYSLRLNPPDARSLGLREGQVVNAVIENRPDGNALLLGKNILIKLPNYVPNPAGGHVQVRLDSIAGGLLSVLFGRKAAPPKAGFQIDDSRLARLISVAPRFEKLWEFLNLGSKADATREGARQLSNFTLGQDWFKRFNHEQIERSLRLSGLFHEQAVRDGAPQPNLKELLLRLLRGGRLDRAEMLFIASAIEDIESGQIESLASQLNRSTQYHWLLPISGDWPIDIRLYGGEPGESEDEDSEQDYAWKVVIKIRVAENETIEVSTVFDRDNVANFYLAMPTDELLDDANIHSAWLESELRKNGIQMGELKIFRKDSLERPNQYDRDSLFEGGKRLLGDA